MSTPKDSKKSTREKAQAARKPEATAEAKPGRLLGALLPHDGATWSFKILGDEAVVARHVDAGDPEALRLQRPGASVARPQRNLALAGPAAHEDGDVLGHGGPFTTARARQRESLVVKE